MPEYDLEILGLSTHETKIVRLASGCETVEQLIHRTPFALLKKKGFGRKRLAALELALGRLGLSLRNERERTERKYHAFPTAQTAAPDRSSESRPFAGVYFIESCGLVKIGQAGDIFNRLQNLMLMSAAPMDLLAYVREHDYDQRGQLEEHFHDVFSDRRKHGEWFQLSEDEVFEFVARQSNSRIFRMEAHRTVA